MHTDIFKQLQQEKREPMQASKWLKTQLLIDEEEMRAFFESIAPFHIFHVSSAVDEEKALIAHQDFFLSYGSYISHLKRGELPDNLSYRPYFSSIFTSSIETIYAIPLSNKILIKPLKPVVQLQSHHFVVSSSEEKFYPMAFGRDSVTWGIQFSYPQLYIDPKTGDIQKVIDSPEFPNTALFHKIIRWVRNHTIPTPFLIKEKRINSPIRLGKKCLKWIAKHPQLVIHDLKINEVY